LKKIAGNDNEGLFAVDNGIGMAVEEWSMRIDNLLATW